jgi:hypothetical protein
LYNVAITGLIQNHPKEAWNIIMRSLHEGVKLNFDIYYKMILKLIRPIQKNYQNLPLTSSDACSMLI